MEKGFLASLFDASFSNLITPRVIKVLYILSMIVIGLTALVFIAAAFADSAATGIITLVVVAPLVALLYLIYTRVILEVIICLFRIMESNVEMLTLQRAAAGPATPPPPPPTGPTVQEPPEPPSSAPPPHPV